MKRVFISISALLIATTLTAQLSLSDSLVAYYPFNGSADDESGNGNHGIVSGPTLTTDKFENISSAYDFNGSHDYITTTGVNTNGTGSISCWIKFDQVTGIQQILEKRQGMNDDFYTEFELRKRSDNTIGFAVAQNDHGDYFVELKSSTTVSDSVWYHIVCTWDGDTSRLFINNSIDTFAVSVGTAFTLSDTIVIGKSHFQSAEGDFHLNGKIDDVRFYTRSLSSDDVGSLYHENDWDKPESGTFTDGRDGRVYKWIEIGNHIWMAENLKATKYSDDTPIPLVEGISSWDGLTSTDRAYCYLDNSSAKGDTFGALYTWAAAMNGASSSDANPSTVQGVCPTGWHLPSDAEWKELEMHLGLSQAEADANGFRGTNEGGMLKSIGLQLWSNPNTGATNSSGFAALPGGRRLSDGVFDNEGNQAYSWTTTNVNATQSWFRALYHDRSNIARGYALKQFGLPVRCVRDIDTSGAIAYFPFNGNATDVSGSGNHGTVTGATLTEDRFGNISSAYEFDGIDDNIQKTAENINQTFSISGWVYLNDTSNNYFLYSEPCSWDQSGTDDHRNRIAVGYGSNNFIPANNRFYLLIRTKAGYNDDEDRYSVVSRQQFNESGWYHVVAIRDGGNYQLYINGLSQELDDYASWGSYTITSQPTSDLRDPYNNEAYIGRYNAPTHQYSSGKYDDLRIYNRVLYPPEIEQLYREGGWYPYSLNLIGVNCTAIEGQDGSIDLSISGGTEPFSISWSDGPVKQDRTGLSAGVYSVTVTDALDSIRTDSIRIYDTFIDDRDTMIYKVVKIGDQIWMAENLNATKYSDGTPIPLIEGISAWNNLSSTDKAYSYYDNNTAKGDTFGALYTWAAAMYGAASSNTNPSAVQGVCPTGWHIPSDHEWKDLEIYLGMDQAEADATSWRGTDEGGKLKESGTSNWQSPNVGATNESGFTAISGGFRRSNGNFGGITGYSGHWSSAEGSSSTAWYRMLVSANSEVDRNHVFDKSYGFSVRCIKDINTSGIIAYYPFNGNANDESGNGNDGTVSGAIPVQDRFGNTDAAYGFDGVDDGIMFNSNTKMIPDSGSISVWFNPQTLNTQDQVSSRSHIFSHFIQNGNNDRLYIRQLDDHIDIWIGDLNYLDTILQLNVDTWYNCVLNYKANYVSVYLNGMKVLDGSYTGFTSEITDFAIGRFDGGDYDYYNGYIDDLGIYKKTLSENEINAILHEGGWYPFSISLEGLNTSGMGADDGSIDLNISGGTSPFTTTWTDGMTTKDRTGLSAGVYTVTVTDALDSIRTDSIRIYDTFIDDRDLKRYTTVQIGEQTWMAENLNATKYSDGTSIPLVEDSAAWNALDYTDKAYCYFDNSGSNGDVFGALYTWEAAMNGDLSSDNNPSQVQGVCPTNWHLPSESEWKELEMYLGMSQAEADTIRWRGTVEGGKLKETGTVHWNSPNIGATNSSGFLALAGGRRSNNGSFEGWREITNFWSSTEIDTYTSWSRLLLHDTANVYLGTYGKSRGHSIRCVLDEPDSGLVAYYPFNENANDESGNGFHGTIAGPLTTNDRFGNPGAAYHFGGDDYITLPSDAINNMDRGTIVAWINLDESGERYCILDKTQTGLINYLQFKVTNIPSGQARLWSAVNVGSTTPCAGETPLGSDSLKTGQWKQVAATWDGDHLRLYIDNILDTIIPHSCGIPDINRSIFIGKIENNTEYFKGSIDDIRIFNYPLSQHEIDSLYSENDWYSFEISLIPSHASSLTASDGQIDLEIRGGEPPFAITWKDGSTSEDRTDLPPGRYSVVVTDANDSIRSDSVWLYSTFVDSRDSTRYRAIKIGEQIWMAENLNATRYSDGTSIPLVTESLAWDMLDHDDKAYCYYGNNDAYKEIFGALYSWSGAMGNGSSSNSNPSLVQGVCPTGWHLPSDAEWKELEIQLGMSASEADGSGFRGTAEGGALKVPGFSHWNSPNTGATNSSGFTALAGGYANPMGGLGDAMGLFISFWSSTQTGTYKAYRRALFNDNARVYRNDYDKEAGFYIRCIQDDTIPPVLLEVSTGIYEAGDTITATSNEEGMIYLVPQGTQASKPEIESLARDTETVSANSPGSLATDTLVQGGVFVVYAIDKSGNISSPSDLITIIPNRPDLSVKWLSPVDPDCGTGKEQPIQVRICNYGDADISTFSVSYTLKTGYLPVSEQITETLGSWDSIDYTFRKKADMSATGNYNCMATVFANEDDNSSNDTARISIMNNSMQLLVESSNTKCKESIGSAFVSVSSGGTSPFSYYWSTRDSTATVDDLASGLYQVTVTDAKGCSKAAVAQISDIGGPNISESSSFNNVSCFGGNDGSIDLVIFGGAAPYQYSWSNGEMTEDLEDLAAGIYEVLIVDMDTCAVRASYEIIEPEEITLSVLTTDAKCGLADGSINVSVAGGTAPYNFLWEGGETTAAISGKEGGIYMLQITDEAGCVDSAQASIDEIGAPEITLNAIYPANCNSTNGIIDISVPGGASSFDFVWSTGAVSEDLLLVGPGEYSVSVAFKDSSCNSTQSYIVPAAQPEAPSICMVTVDSLTESNMIVWEKGLSGNGIIGFNIYRESSRADVYVRVGTRTRDEESFYIDSNANPEMISWKYKLTMVDECGSESDMSPKHKTIHLSANQGINDVVNLDWDNYLGFDYGTYRIYRFSATRDTTEWLWDLAGTPSDLSKTFTDLNPPSREELYYYVAVERGSSCVSSKKASTHNTVRSNKSKKIKLGPVSVAPIPEGISDFSLYPNPNRGDFTVEFESRKVQDVYIRIYNSSGKLITTRRLENATGRYLENLKLTAVGSGLYYLQLIINDGVVSRIFAVEGR